MQYPTLRRHWLVGLISIGLTACGGAASSPPAPPEVTLEASSAPAGSMLKIYGLDVDACPLRTSEVKVAGETAPAVLDARHEVLIRLPLFYDAATKWSAPPSGPQDVEVFCKGTPWTTLPAAIIVTELPRAPGTTEAIVANYTQIISDYERLLEALIPEPGAQQQLYRSIFGALESLLSGTHANSLPALLDDLEQNHPDVLALLDAMHAIGSADEGTTNFKERMQEMSVQAVASAAEAPAGSVAAPASSTIPPMNTPPGTAPKLAVPTIEESIPYTDEKLARHMQTYVVIRGMSEQLVAQTRAEFGALHDLASDLGIKLPAADRVKLILFSLDYIMNKLVVAVFPATLRPIKITLPQTELQNSERTASQFILIADNVPAGFSINDLKDMAETLFGAPDVDEGADTVLGWIASFEELLPKVAEFVFAQLKEEFKEYASLYPEGVDRDLERFGIIPRMHFQATAKTRELYRLWPQDSNVIRPLDDVLEWGASETHWGSAELYVTPTPAPYQGFWGSLYAGGAFGENDNIRSEGVRVTVGELSLLLEQHSIFVPEGDSATVGVKLSHEPATEEDSVEVNAKRVSGDSDISVISAHPLVFTASNWDVYRHVVLAAAEDDEDDEDDEATISVSAVVELEGEGPVTLEATLIATEEDNDRQSFVTDEYRVSVPEDSTAVFNVKLSEPPDSPVTAIVAYSSGDSDIKVRSPNTMPFDENNWDSYQTVTLYARPDEDAENGSAKFKISANPPATIDDRYITAIEQEEGQAGTSLTIQYEDWNDDQRVSVQGTIQVELDPENFDLPLQDEGTLAASATGYSGNFTGIAYLEITNHPLEPACPCGGEVCYERQSPEDTILDIDGRIRWDCPPDISCITYYIHMTLPFLSDSTFETTCDFGYFVSYSAELN